MHTAYFVFIFVGGPTGKRQNKLKGKNVLTYEFPFVFLPYIYIFFCELKKHHIRKNSYFFHMNVEKYLTFW